MSAFANGLSTASSSSNQASASALPLRAGAAATAGPRRISQSNTASAMKGPDAVARRPDDGAAAALLNPLSEASSVAEVRAALGSLHEKEQALTTRLEGLASSHADLGRDLLRLDNLRATLGAQVIATRTISNTMLAGPAETAARLSGKVRTLDLEKARVQATLKVVEQVAELKACVAGVAGSMGAPQDWEAAAGYLARAAAAVPDEILHCGFANAVVPTIETPESPAAALEARRESLCGLFRREFNAAAAEGDGAKVTRFFKLFPLIGRGDVGLDEYGRYVCQGVAGTARATLRDLAGAGAGGQRRGAAAAAGVGAGDGLVYAGALTKLFEHIARIVDGHGGLVERHYGSGKMVRVIERLQAEVDVQGGIILDSWSDERTVDRKLTEVKSYPWSFLTQSFLAPQRSTTFGGVGTPRVNSPALGAGSSGASAARNSEDEGNLNMKEVDGLLAEIALMLAKWSLYARFLAGKCRDADAPDDAPLVLPPVVIKSNLSNKVSNKLISPYNTLASFYFRRSVEKAFQLDESPSGLSLSMSKALDGNPPYIISAVDDVMYIANTVLQRSISTSQTEVASSVIPTVGRVLGSDFAIMIQRRMRDESYPAAQVQGGFPPEDKIIAFIVLINSLDMAKDYLSRIIASRLGGSGGGPPENGTAPSDGFGGPKDYFPIERDAAAVTRELRMLEATFSAKAEEILQSGIGVLTKEVVRPRLRPIISETFRDADYGLSEADLSELAAQNDEDEADLLLRLEQVGRRFEHRWDALMQPLARIMTARTYGLLLDDAARYLARMLEKRLAASSGKVNAFGAVRMERDFSAIVSAVTRGNYALREAFARVSQILMVANMEDDEWEELVAEEERGGSGMQWVLGEDERVQARNLVRSS